MNKFLILILVCAVLNYVIRLIPLVLCKSKEPSPFLKSFLEYIPYAALGGLLFPDILFSVGNVGTAIIGGGFASFLILKKQNMLVVVGGTIALVYVINLLIARL